MFFKPDGSRTRITSATSLPTLLFLAISYPAVGRAINLVPGDIVIAGAAGVSRVDRTTGQREFFASFGGERGAGGIVMDANGDIYAVAAGPDSSSVYRIDPTTEQLTLLASVGGTGRDLEFDTAGNLLIVTGQDSGCCGSVRRLNLASGQVTELGSGGGGGAFYDVILESDHSLLVGEFGGVSRFNIATGSKTMLCAMNGGATGLARANDGMFYVATLAANVGRLSLDTCDFNVIGSGGGVGTTVVVDNDGSLLTGVRDRFNAGGLRRFHVGSSEFTQVYGGFAVNDVLVIPVPEPTGAAHIAVLGAIATIRFPQIRSRVRHLPI